MMNNGSLYDLQKILGHSDYKLTEKTYAHLSPGHLKEKANVVQIGAGDNENSPKDDNSGSNVVRVNFRR